MSAPPIPTPADQRRETCPVLRFGRPHVYATGAFYWPLNGPDRTLYEGYDFVMCGACGQIEPD